MLGDDAGLTAAVLAAQHGDEDAFRTVYRAVQPRLLGYIRTLVGEPDAEDVASESWLQIARDLDRFSGDADRFRGWAARIARNRALDHLRMRGRRPAIGGDETELSEKPAFSDTADEAIESLATGRTMSLIAQLPQDQAEAVVLRVVVGLDAKSAAQTLGKRPGAVRTAAHRGLKRLAELLRTDSGEGRDDTGRPPAGGGLPDPGAPEGIRPPGAATGTGAPEGIRPRGGATSVGASEAGRPHGAVTDTGLPRAAAPEGGLPRGGAAGGPVVPPRRPAGPGAPSAALRNSTADAAELGAVPAQRPSRTGLVAPAGVTHSRPRTQKDM
ncbi:sigma-70 family RNA polymerase sigma factor [Streptomyces castrisilvae]|uniref:Sigma-70 family RNA polymerase sigma factor n=1 Tax=Streptomyces castrisilvae TaxID=3033811 RepID=A0ABY9HMT5_9ACTN|nr:sigma-70 family RNA polymerase sigma factor [Streptomyces sp. Mut1]WLQ35850.1 sigma-70 family RNA polymerase sigma factor [Streptomyces sp. Mut1]